MVQIHCMPITHNKLEYKVFCLIWTKSCLVLTFFSLKRFHSSRCACQRSLFVLWPLLLACVSTITHTHWCAHKLSKDTTCWSVSDQYLTQYFWDSLTATGNVKIPMIGLKMPCPSSQPMSLSLISNENVFSLVSHTMRRFSVSQTSAVCRSAIYTLRPH